MKQRKTILWSMAAVLPLGLTAIASSSGNSLEEKIAQALATNPEIQMAHAKVLQAEAEHRLVRLRVAQDVLESHNEFETQRHVLDASHRRLQHARQQYDSGMLQQSEMEQLELELIQAESRLSQIKARERFVLGASLPEGSGTTQMAAPMQERDSVPTHFIDDLATNVTVSFEEATIRQILETLSNLMLNAAGEDGLRIIIDEEMLEQEFDLDDTLTLKAGTVPVGHALLMLADKRPVRFVFRDYGLLATTEYRALYMSGASIPAGLPLETE